MGAIYTSPNHLTCQRALAMPPAVGNATRRRQCHRVLAMPPDVGNATGCWQCHRVLAIPTVVGIRQMTHCRYVTCYAGTLQQYYLMNIIQ